MIEGQAVRDAIEGDNRRLVMYLSKKVKLGPSPEFFIKSKRVRKS